MLFVAFYQIVDGMMVGRRLGPEALASVNILYPVFALLAGLGVMIGVGGNARIALLLGAGEYRKASRVLGLILSLGVGIGLAGSLAAILLMSRILALLGTSGGELGTFAGHYFKGFIPFFVFMLLTFILEQSVRNDGSPHLASGVMAVCALMNIGLDYVFLFVLDMGIIGASLASGISQTIGAFVFLGYFFRKTQKQKPGLVIAAPEGSLKTLRAVVINGSSEMFNSLAAGITTFLFNRLILSHVGVLGVAAFTLVQYLLLVGMFIVLGIGNGTQPIFSYNHGAGLHHRVKGALWRVALVCTLVGAGIFGLITWQTAPVAVLFLPDQPEALQMSLEVAGFVRWSMLFMPLAMLGSLYFTALEQAAASLAVSVSRGLLLPVAGLVIFPAWWGAAGIWITPVFAEGITVLIVAGSLLWQKERNVLRNDRERSKCVYMLSKY
jgi:Na+-driven multidrug efflux pump